jgi:hypothetical protein
MSAARTPPTLSGTIRLYVKPAAPLGPDEAAELRAVVEHFFEALRVRALPGTMGTVHTLEQKPEGVLDARFDVIEVELGSFRVLHGMLEGFSCSVAPLGGAIAWREPPSDEGTVDLLAATAPLVSPDAGHEPPPHAENLLTTNAPLPTLGARVPFEVSFSFQGGAAPPLAIEVVFANPLTDDDKDRLDREIRVWAALVQGGYPLPGDPPGASAMGPFTVRFDDPQTLRLSAESFLAGDECFDSLKALLLRWHTTTPVVSLETE